MKDFIKKIDWSIVFFLIFSGILFSTIVTLTIFVSSEIEKPNADITRRIRICKTYSTDFWRNDIDFIDGKCYYKGKEVEIK
jgi:hypothetical protein